MVSQTSDRPDGPEKWRARQAAGSCRVKVQRNRESAWETAPIVAEGVGTVKAATPFMSTLAFGDEMWQAVVAGDSAPHKEPMMGAKLLDGVAVAAGIRVEAAMQARALAARTGVVPGLAVVLVGDDPASATYVRTKSRACKEAGVFAQTFSLPKSASEAEVLALVARLNDDQRFHGILVQLPLPPQVNERNVTHAIDPDKDVDGLHPRNMGLLLEGAPAFVPCTPAGIQQLLLRSGYDPSGKRVVVCGRSNIVGKPVAVLLMQKARGANATVTVCHTGTRDIVAHTRQADILIAAAGSPGTITGDMVKSGVVVVDVGINRVADPSTERGYRLVGDVDFASVEPKAEAITPVPGGVGPMTVAMLLVNTLRATERRAVAIART